MHCCPVRLVVPDSPPRKGHHPKARHDEQEVRHRKPLSGLQTATRGGPGLHASAHGGTTRGLASMHLLPLALEQTMTANNPPRPHCTGTGRRRPHDRKIPDDLLAPIDGARWESFATPETTPGERTLLAGLDNGTWGLWRRPNQSVYVSGPGGEPIPVDSKKWPLDRLQRAFDDG